VVAKGQEYNRGRAAAPTGWFGSRLYPFRQVSPTQDEEHYPECIRREPVCLVGKLTQLLGIAGLARQETGTRGGPRRPAWPVTHRGRPDCRLDSRPLSIGKQIASGATGSHILHDWSVGEVL